MYTRLHDLKTVLILNNISDNNFPASPLLRDTFGPLCDLPSTDWFGSNRVITQFLYWSIENVLTGCLEACARFSFFRHHDINFLHGIVFLRLSSKPDKLHVQIFYLTQIKWLSDTELYCLTALSRPGVSLFWHVRQHEQHFRLPAISLVPWQGQQYDLAP